MEVEEEGEREGPKNKSRITTACPEFVRRFHYFFKPPAVGRRLRRRLGQAVGAFRPRCRTGAFGARLASVLTKWILMRSERGLTLYPHFTHATRPQTARLGQAG